MIFFGKLEEKMSTRNQKCPEQFFLRKNELEKKKLKCPLCEPNKFVISSQATKREKNAICEFFFFFLLAKQISSSGCKKLKRSVHQNKSSEQSCLGFDTFEIGFFHR